MGGKVVGDYENLQLPQIEHVNKAGISIPVMVQRLHPGGPIIQELDIFFIEYEYGTYTYALNKVNTGAPGILFEGDLIFPPGRFWGLVAKTNHGQDLNLTGFLSAHIKVPLPQDTLYWDAEGVFEDSILIELTTPDHWHGIQLSDTVTPLHIQVNLKLPL
jgi:hypothetical protein